MNTYAMSCRFGRRTLWFWDSIRTEQYFQLSSVSLRVWKNLSPFQPFCEHFYCNWREVKLKGKEWMLSMYEMWTQLTQWCPIVRDWALNSSIGNWRQSNQRYYPNTNILNGIKCYQFINALIHWITFTFDQYSTQCQH